MFLYAKRIGGPPRCPYKAKNCSINTGGDIKEKRCPFLLIHPIQNVQSMLCKFPHGMNGS